MKAGRPKFTLTKNLSRKYSSRVQYGRAARRIWEIKNGQIPEGMEIDHINRDWSDNRIENLRLVSRSENNMNRGAFYTNTSGEKNVAWGKRDKIWIVNIKRDSFRFFFRTKSLDKAIKVAREKRKEIHGQFATA